MKKENFDTRLERILKRNEDHFYSLCESVSDKMNFWQNYRSPIDLIRIRFFPKANRVILYDVEEEKFYHKEDKNGRRIGLTPTEALRQIAEWSDGEIWESQLEIEETVRHDAEMRHWEETEGQRLEQEHCADIACSVGISSKKAGCYC